MKNSKHLVIGFMCVLLTAGCSRDAELQKLAPVSELYNINLKWNKAYEAETQQMVQTGLNWALSYLGAALPYNSNIYSWKDHYVMVAINAAGFEPASENAMMQLINKLKNSDEYKKTGAIDVGRFIVLTIGSPNHYYKITNANAVLEEDISNSISDSGLFALVASTVSKTARLIKDVSQKEAAFISTEGVGDPGSSYSISEFEKIDIMPNGQIRVALYTSAHELKAAADTQLSIAGKPAKCLWCHESRFLPNFAGSGIVSGYLTKDSFNNLIATKQNALLQKQLGILSKVDYSKKQDHALMELLYISFMEPSAKRLANEWNMSEHEVQQKLAGLQTHSHGEFPHLGSLYNRSEVEQFSPFVGIRVPESVREISTYEPDLIR